MPAAREVAEARAPDALDKAPAAPAAAPDAALEGTLDATLEAALEAMPEEAPEEALEGVDRAAPAATKKPCKTC
jgi:hypothetical protein